MKHLLMIILCVFVFSCKKKQSNDPRAQVAKAEQHINHEEYQQAISILETLSPSTLQSEGKPLLLVYAYLGASGFKGTEIYSLVKAIRNYDHTQDFLPELEKIAAEIPSLDQHQQQYLEKAITYLEKEIPRLTSINEKEHFYIGNIYAFKVLVELKITYEAVKTVDLSDPVKTLASLSQINIFSRLPLLYRYTEAVRNHYDQSYPKLHHIVEDLDQWLQKASKVESIQ